MSLSVQAADAVLTIRDAYIRLGPPGATLAGYGVLVNHSAQAIVIKDANAPWAGMTMMHESREEDGVAKMRHVDQIVVPPHGEVALKPGGLHLMFMKTPKDLKAGDQLDVIFDSETSQQWTLRFDVKKTP